MYNIVRTPLVWTVALSCEGLFKKYIRRPKEGGERGMETNANVNADGHLRGGGGLGNR